MKRKRTKWLLQFVRLALCAAAIVYIVNKVDWYDYVTLNDGAGTQARVLEYDEQAGEIVIERDGQSETFAVNEQNIVYVAQGEIPVQPGIRGVVTGMDVGLGLLAILIFLPVPVLQSIRLVWMLGVQNVKLSYWNAFKLTYAGNFFNFALPGTVGGDLIKAYYITSFTHHKTEAVTTVFLDRVVGLSGLMILASVTFFFAWNRIEWPPAYRHGMAVGLGAIWCGLAVGCLFLFSRRLRHLIRAPQIAEKLPARDQILRIGRATVAMRRHKTLVIMSLLNTLVLQLTVVVAAYVMSRALGMHGHFSLYFICVPIGFLIGAVPITPPQAFGVMEGAYLIFFSSNGLNPSSAAVAFALANRLTQLAWALPGVLVPLFGAHVPNKAELEELEHFDPEDADADQAGGAET